jgi:hypothetical protein
LLVLLRSASCLSFTSPCGPSGLGWTNICTIGFGEWANSPEGWASNPRADNSLITAAAADRLRSSSVLETVTPFSSGGFVPKLTGPSRISRTDCGSPTFHFANSCIATSMSEAKPNASTSPTLYTKAVSWRGNAASLLPISEIWSLVSLRHATLSSIFTRAIRSSSVAFFSPAASLWSPCASFSFAEARSLASPAFHSASAARSSMCAIICPEKCDVRAALNNSPPIPSMSTSRDSLSSLCLDRLLLRQDVNPATNSPTQPSATTAVEPYPIHSHQRNADFNDATSESVRIILDHQKGAGPPLNS